MDVAFVSCIRIDIHYNIIYSANFYILFKCANNKTKIRTITKGSFANCCIISIFKM